MLIDGLNGTTDPSNNVDGAYINAMYVNTTSGTVFVCTDATPNAQVWVTQRELPDTATEGEVLTFNSGNWTTAAPTAGGGGAVSLVTEYTTPAAGFVIPLDTTVPNKIVIYATKGDFTLRPRINMTSGGTSGGIYYKSDSFTADGFDRNISTGVHNPADLHDAFTGYNTRVDITVDLVPSTNSTSVTVAGIVHTTQGAINTNGTGLSTTGNNSHFYVNFLNVPASVNIKHFTTGA